MQIRVAIVLWGSGIGGGGGAERRFARVLRCFPQDSSSLQVLWASNAHLVDDLVMSRVIDQQEISSRFIPLDSCAFRGVVDPVRFFRLMRSYGIDVLHFPLIQGSLSPVYLALHVKPEYSVVATVAFADYAAREKTGIHTQLAGALLLKRARFIDSLYSVFPEMYPKYRAKTRVTPCSFTDYDLFTPRHPKRREVVFCGRLIPSKQPGLFFDAVRLLAKRSEPTSLRQWRFRIVGGGELKTKLVSMTRDYGLELILSVEQTHTAFSILNHSSIFVSLGMYENYPSQSLLEAMAAGNAVVATDVGETRRLLDSSFASLVPPGEMTSERLASELLRLITDEPRRLEMGKRGREVAMQKHRIETFGEYLSSLWSACQPGCGDAR